MEEVTSGSFQPKLCPSSKTEAHVLRFTPGTPGRGELVTLLLPPVPPVFIALIAFTGGTGGRFEIRSNRARVFESVSGDS